MQITLVYLLGFVFYFLNNTVCSISKLYYLVRSLSVHLHASGMRMMLYWSQRGGFSFTSEDSLFFVPFSLQTESTAIALLLQPLGLDLSTCITHTAKVS